MTSQQGGFSGLGAVTKTMAIFRLEFWQEPLFSADQHRRFTASHAGVYYIRTLDIPEKGGSYERVHWGL
jgi:hypothetical protein